MKIYNFFKNKPVWLLIFALVSGLAYFCILMNILITPMSAGKPPIIGWFFAPAIVCGMAYVIVKYIKLAIENEAPNRVLKMFWLHVAVIIMGIGFLVAMFM